MEKVGRAFWWILDVITWVVPFSREFRKCSARDFKEAFQELAITTFFSTMPLWIMPLLGPIIFRTDVSFSHELVGTVTGGELFVYCAALVGPLIYIITRRYGELSEDKDRFGFTIAFPHGVSFVLVSAMICLFAGFAFSLMKNPIFLPKDSPVHFNANGIFWTSIVVYVFSLYCIFSASAYRNAMAEFVRDTPREEDTFSAQFENRTHAE
ncbi:hypothetical protein [Bradyrhizobium sp. USDA 4529]